MQTPAPSYLSPFARLPTYYIKEIFQLAAGRHRTSAHTLAMVCKVTQRWVDPILYETVVIRDSNDYESIKAAVAGKPAEFFKTVVKRIYHHGLGFPEALKECASLQYIAMKGYPRMCPDYGHFDSSGLTVSLLCFAATYFDRPLFNAVTNLHCHFCPWMRGAGHSSGQLAAPRYIPHLSRLRLRFNPRGNSDENIVDLIADLLMARPRLSLLVYEAELHPEQEDPEETIRQLAMIDDSRLIVIMVDEHEERRGDCRDSNFNAKAVEDELYPWGQVAQDYWNWRDFSDSETRSNCPREEDEEETLADCSK